MQLRHVLLRILKEAIGKETFYILSVCQIAIKALGNCKMNSKLVQDCHHSLMVLAECTSFHFLWVLAHKEIEGNEIADQLAKRGSLYPFIGPEI
jgi:hypothetical protein